MDKSWVWLPRISPQYEDGATKFVYESAKTLGNPAEMFCPCSECRNLCHQQVDIFLEHLIIKGMDERYKRKSCWINHGDIRNVNKEDDPSCGGDEAFNLIRTAFFQGDYSTHYADHNGDEKRDTERKEEYDFKKKLTDAETLLYSGCFKYTKV